MIHTHSLPCACVGTCGVALVIAIDGIKEEPQSWFIEFYEQVGNGKGFRWRARAAWRVLRGKDPWTHDVALEPPQLAELSDWIEHTIKATEVVD